MPDEPGGAISALGTGTWRARRLAAAALWAVSASAAAADDAAACVLPEAAAVDWVVAPVTTPSAVCATADGVVVLGNGIVERRIATSPNAHTTSLKHLPTATEMLHAGGNPEAVVSLDGTAYDVGGATASGGFVYAGHTVEDGTHKPYDWTPYLADGATVKPWSEAAPWPAKGKSVVFAYTPHASLPQRLQGLEVRIRYEIYDGIAAIMKKVFVANSADDPVELTGLVIDRLSVAADAAGRLLVDADYHGSRGVHRRNDFDRTYTEEAGDGYRDVTVLYKRGPAFHVGNRAERSGQRWETTFESFRSFLLLHGTDHYEAQRMEFKAMYRTVAPQLREDLLFVNVNVSDQRVADIARDAAAVGFEAVVQSFWSGFDIHPFGAAAERQRVLHGQVRGHGLRTGGYELFLQNTSPYYRAGSICRHERWGGYVLGLASEGYKAFHAATLATIDRAGLGVLEIDAAYPLSECANAHHAYMVGGADSQHKQWVINNERYRDFRSRDVYLNVADWHFLNGTNKSGIGYVEAAWSRPRQEQLLVDRMYIYNGTYEKSPPWAWSFIPIARYKPGPDPAAATYHPTSTNAADYNWALAQNFLTGVQHTFYGSGLYDTPAVRDLVRYWVDVYKTYRATLKGDVVHIRPPRPDPDAAARATGMDAFVHVAPGRTERALLVVFNQTDAARTERLAVPLYHAGLTDLAAAPASVPGSRLSTSDDIPSYGGRQVYEAPGLVPAWDDDAQPSATATERTVDFHLEGGGVPRRMALDSNGTAMLEVTLPPMSFTWYAVTEAGDRPATPPAKPVAIRSAVADLNGLELAGLALAGFASERTDYRVDAPDDVLLTTVTAVPADPRATVAVEPTDADADTEGHQVELAAATAIRVVVTAENGASAKTYEVVVSRSSAQPVAMIAADAAEVAEGTPAAFTVRLDRAAVAPLTVAVAVTENGAMLAGDPPTSVAFAAGASMAALSVATAADTLAENDSTVEVALGTGTGYVLGSPSTARATVVDDDEALVAEFSSVPESHDDRTPFTLELRFSADVDVTPESLRDEVLAATNGRIASVGPRAPPGKAVWLVTVEPTERDGDVGDDIAVSLPARSACDEAGAVCTAGGALLSNSPSVRVPAAAPPATAAEPAATIAAVASEVAEGAPAAFAVTISAAQSAPLSVAVSLTATGAVLSEPLPALPLTATPAPVAVLSLTATGAAPAGPYPASVQFAPGETTATLAAATVDDRVVSGGAALTAAVAAGDGYAPGTPASATVAVRDDDAAAFALDAVPAAVAEGRTSTLNLSVTNGTTFARAQEIALAVTGVVSADDFALPATVTLATGASLATAAFEALADEVDEEAETATVTARLAGRPVASATVTVTSGPASSDASLASLALSGVDIGAFDPETTAYAASAPHDVAWTTVAARASDPGATVAVSPADADAASPGHQVALAVGATAVSVAVTAADGTRRTYTATVTRAAAPTATLAATAAAVSEGEAAAFALTLSAAQSRPLSVAVSLTATGAALRAPLAPLPSTATGAALAVLSLTATGAAQSGPLAVSVPFAAGETTATMAAATVDDRVVSGDAALTATLAAAPGYAVGSPASATMAVLDDDAAAFAVTAAPAAIEEGATSTLTVSVTNGTTYARAREIALAVTGDVAADDYALPPTVTLATGAALATATFEALADEVDEDAETATVTARLDGADLGTATLTVSDPGPPRGAAPWLSVLPGPGLRVAWQPPDGASGFAYRHRTGDGAWTAAPAAAGSAARIAGLARGTTYEVQVRAAGEPAGAWSQSARMRTPDGPGLGNLAYPARRLDRSLARVLPPRLADGRRAGTNVAAMVNGYFLTVFAPDGGRGPGGFLLYDVSAPDRPRLVKSIHEPAGRTAEIREAHALGAARIGAATVVAVQSTRGVEFWDFTDVDDVRRLSRLRLPGVNGGDYFGVAWQLWWQAPYLYVAASSLGVFVVDASDPARPYVARMRGQGANPLPPGAYGGFKAGPVFAFGNRLLLASMGFGNTEGWARLDISDPLDPTLLSRTGALDDHYAACFDGARAFSAPRRGGQVAAYGVAEPAGFALLGATAATQNYLYCAARDDELFLGGTQAVSRMALGDGAPTWTRDIALGGGGEHGHVTVLGNLLYVGDDHGRESAFVPVAADPDRTPPRVVAVSPPDGAAAQALGTRVGVAFSDSVLLESATAGTLRLVDAAGSAVEGTYSVQLGLVNFAPAAPLEPDATYAVVVPVGGVTDVAGNPVATAFRSTFATAAAPASDAVAADTLGVAAATLDAVSTVGVEAAFEALAQTGASYRWEFGDGSEASSSESPRAMHAYAQAGHYTVVLTVTVGDDARRYTFVRTAAHPRTALAPAASSSVAGSGELVFNVNPDNGTVTATHRRGLTKVWETRVGRGPRTLAVDADGRVWAAVQGADRLVGLDAAGAVHARVDVGHGRGPYGVAFVPGTNTGLATLQHSREVLRFDAATGAVLARRAVDGEPRGIAVATDGYAYVTRFRSVAGAAVAKIDAATLETVATVELPTDATTVDDEDRARGRANYLNQVVVSPDGREAWLPSKKDNVLRGERRDGLPLVHDATVRAAASVIDLASAAELADRRVDFDDRAGAHALAFSPRGDYVFVAMRGSDTVEILDAYTGAHKGAMASVGRAPQGVWIDEAGEQAFVHNFATRSVSVFDVSGVLGNVSFEPPLSAHVATVASDVLDADQLAGLRIFYGARDPRMSRDGYLSCASCHLEGGDDGVVWDFSDRGEGLRNTISLRGRKGTAHGRLHWTANFDEIQDFENDIRAAFGGTGFMAEADFAATSAPLGPPKAGRSAPLDALARYVATFNDFGRSPHRTPDGGMTDAAKAGRSLFAASGCDACHAGAAFTDAARHDVGTLGADSGEAGGIDTPTLLGAWRTAPYFHDGSAPTLAAVLASGHGGAGALAAAERASLAAYVASLERAAVEFVQVKLQAADVCLEADLAAGFLAQAACDADDPLQMWRFADAGTIRPMTDDGKCLTTDGYAVRIGDCAGTDEQRWRFSDGVLRSQSSLAGGVVDQREPASDLPGEVSVRPYNARRWQLWHLRHHGREPAAGGDAALSSLSIAGADLAFDAEVTDYAASVDGAEVVVAAEAQSAAATVRLADGAVDEAGPSRISETVALGPGTNRIVVEVVAEDGQVVRHYVVAVTSGAASDDAGLASLALSGADIGAFDPDTTAYAAAVAHDVAWTTVTARASDAGATVAVSPADGDAASPGHQVALAVGATAVAVAVTAADGTERTYTATVTRAAAPTATLAATSPTASEGAAAGFEVTLSAAQSGPLSVAVSLTATGAVLAEPLPAVPLTATGAASGRTLAVLSLAATGAARSGPLATTVPFAAGETTAALSAATVADRVVSGDAALTATLDAGAGYAVGSPASATVTVLDDDVAEFGVVAQPAEVEEGAASTLTVSITNGVTYAAAQEIALTVTGDVDASDYALPATVELAAGASSAFAEFAALADEADEEPETATVTASLGGAEIGAASVTVADQPPLPALRVEGVPQLGATLSAVFAEPVSGTGAAAARAAATSVPARGLETVYRWLRDGVEIPGATGAAHVLTAADVGAAVSVRAARGIRSEESAATVPVWGAPGNPAVGTDEATLLSTTMTLGSRGFSMVELRVDFAGYMDETWYRPVGSLDAAAFELDGTRYRLTTFAVIEDGGFAFATQPVLPSAAGLVGYWDGYRLADFAGETADANGWTTWGTWTPQPREEYERYMHRPGRVFSGPSDGVRVAVSLRREVGVPTATVSATAATVSEGGAAAFAVSLDGPREAAVTVSLETAAAGAALAAAAPSSATFAPGETRATLDLATVDDAVVSGDGTVTVTLAAGDGYELGASTTATVSVAEDDAAQFAVSASPAEVVEGGSSTVTVAIANGVTYATAREVSLAVTGDVSASDYALPATVALAAGASSATAVFAALADDAAEEAETATVTATVDGAAVGAATVAIRPLRRDATLSSLSLTDADIGPFDAATTDYAAEVAHEVASTTVSAEPSDAAAAVEIADAAGSTLGTQRTSALAEGSNAISATVTAEDGATTRTYAVAVERPPQWGARRPGRDVDLGDASQATGIWSDGETLWAVPDWDGAALRAYDLATGERLTSRDLTLEAGRQWTDLHAHGGTLWASSFWGGVLAYRLSDGARSADRDLTAESLSEAGGERPSGVFSAGGTLWVLDHIDRKAYAHAAADGARQPEQDVALGSRGSQEGGAWPWGAWTDGEVLLTSNWGRGRVLAYRLSDGAPLPAMEVDTAAAGNGDPLGLWSDGVTLWVVDGTDRKAYAYAAPGLRRASADSLESRASAVPSRTPGPPLPIPDPALRAALAAALGKPPHSPVGARELAALESLDARAAGIADLSGLQHAVRLQALDLSGNPLADLRALASLPRLADLRLDATGAQPWDVASLTSLRRLSLRGNGIDSIEALSALRSLEHLDIGGNRIADLAALANLPRLADLRADGNRVADVAPLLALPSLATLDLRGNPVDDTDALERLPRLPR